MTPAVLSVNVGLPRAVAFRDETVMTAIYKEPVQGRQQIRGVNVVGDDQADRSVHGGRDKAVYAYAREDLDWWEAELGAPLAPGTFGENLTLAGVVVSEAVVGEQWRIGTALLQVAQPRVPCFKLGIRMGDPAFPRRFAAAERAGAYLRILEEGDVAAGDAVEIVARPDHGVTVRAVTHAYHGDHSQAGALLYASELAPGWLQWALDQVERGGV